MTSSQSGSLVSLGHERVHESTRPKGGRPLRYEGLADGDGAREKDAVLRGHEDDASPVRGLEGVFSAIVPEGEERRSERESGREVVGLECRARGPRVRESIAEPEDAASRRGVVEDRSLQSVLWRPLLVLRRWDADDDVE